MGHSKYILGANHQTIACEDLHYWGRWMETADRVVRQETVGEWLVSTVFLGLDHQFGEGEPLVFETMIFPSGEFMEQYCDRYSTWDQAVAGHERVVEEVKAGRLPEKEN